MKYYIKIKDEIVHRTKDKKEALKIIAKIFRARNFGDEDVYLHGGKIGKWRTL